MPKFSVCTNDESRGGNFRRMMDAIKSGESLPRMLKFATAQRSDSGYRCIAGETVHEGQASHRRCSDLSPRTAAQEVRITYYTRSAMDIGCADDAKSALHKIFSVIETAIFLC